MKKVLLLLLLVGLFASCSRRYRTCPTYSQTPTAVSQPVQNS